MITKNKVVTLSYSLKTSDGEEMGQADSQEPFSYLHGSGQIVPGLEKEIAGMKIGDKKEVTVSPEEGYGEEIADLRVSVQRSQFPEEMKLVPGQQFSADVAGTQRVFTIMEVQAEQVLVDGNHPLAGKTLHFSVEILGVRDATQEEMEHGHSHDSNHSHEH
ncbi:MAG: peptidylprolyl isomerase [Nitrospinales bacterium]